MKQDDILLQELIRKGDKEAFKYLFDLYFVPLCRFGVCFLEDKQEVEQLALDIFVYVWEERETLNINLSFKAYLFQAMRNRCLNQLRDKKETCAIDEVGGLYYSEDYSKIEIEELSVLIESAILALPERCREIFCKSRKEHLSYQEIAENMQISVKTVEAQITKALKKIKAYLGDKYSFLF